MKSIVAFFSFLFISLSSAHAENLGREAYERAADELLYCGYFSKLMGQINQDENTRRLMQEASVAFMVLAVAATDFPFVQSASTAAALRYKRDFLDRRAGEMTDDEVRAYVNGKISYCVGLQRKWTSELKEKIPAAVDTMSNSKR